MSRSMRGNRGMSLNRSMSANRGMSLNRSMSRGRLNRSMSAARSRSTGALSRSRRGGPGGGGLNRSMAAGRSMRGGGGGTMFGGGIAPVPRTTGGHDSTIQQELEKESDILHPDRPADEHREIARAETEAFIAQSKGNLMMMSRALGGRTAAAAPATLSPSRPALTSTDHFRAHRSVNPNRSMRGGVGVTATSLVRNNGGGGAADRGFSRGDSTIAAERDKERMMLDPAVNVDEHRENARRETDDFKRNQWGSKRSSMLPAARSGPTSLSRSLSRGRMGRL